jgi:hypothetical protein
LLTTVTSPRRGRSSPQQQSAALELNAFMRERRRDRGQAKAEERKHFFLKKEAKTFAI